MKTFLSILFLLCSFTPVFGQYKSGTHTPETPWFFDFGYKTSNDNTIGQSSYEYLADYSPLHHFDGSHNKLYFSEHERNTHIDNCLLGKPSAFMLRERNSPYDHGDDDYSQDQEMRLGNALNEIANLQLNLDFVCSDIEFGNEEYDHLAVTAIARILRESGSIGRVKHGAYSYFQSPVDISRTYSNFKENTTHSTYVSEGLDVSMPSCYHLSSYMTHATHNPDWDFAKSPNIRSALFWAPIAKFSAAKEHLQPGHLLIPWVAGFDFVKPKGSETYYECAPPSRSDLIAAMRHYRFRGADGYYRLYRFTRGSTLPNWFNASWMHQEYRTHEGEQKHMLDLKHAWDSLDGMFGPEKVTELNSQPDADDAHSEKKSGVIFSGIRHVNDVKILISNLGNNSATVELPILYDLPSEVSVLAPVPRVDPISDSENAMYRYEECHKMFTHKITNLIENGDFESGIAGWSLLNSGSQLVNHGVGGASSKALSVGEGMPGVATAESNLADCEPLTRMKILVSAKGSNAKMGGWIYRDESGTTVQLGDTGRGVAVSDAATGVGYIMYTEESVHHRFLGANEYNADHFVAVRLVGFDETEKTYRWQFNNNAWDVSSSWVDFVVAPNDRLMASVNFSEDTVSSLEGIDSRVGGILAGYSSGDLEFFPNQWNGTSNDGEFEIAGLAFTFGGGESGGQSRFPVQWQLAGEYQNVSSNFVTYVARFTTPLNGGMFLRPAFSNHKRNAGVTNSLIIDDVIVKFDDGNLLGSGDFDSGKADGWDLRAGAHIVPDGYCSTPAIRLNGGKIFGVRQLNTMAVSPNQSIKVSAKCRSNEEPPAGFDPEIDEDISAGSVGVSFSCLDQNLNHVTYISTKWIEVPHRRDLLDFTNRNPDDGNFLKLCFDGFEVPAGTSYLRIKIEAEPGFDVTIDDIDVR